MCVCCSHARLGPCDHHHAQSDAFVQVPLLYRGCQADDSHQQQGGVFTVLCCHLNTHKEAHFKIKVCTISKYLTTCTIWSATRETGDRKQRWGPPSPTSPLHPPSFGSTLTVCHLFFLICSTSHPQGSWPRSVV